MKKTKTWLALGSIALIIGATSAYAFFGENKAPQNALHESEKTSFRHVIVAENLHHPWSLAFLPNDEFLVTERRGNLIRITDNGEKQEIKGIPPVYDNGQGGLLDVLVPDDFKDRDYIYFTYAAPDAQNPDLGGTQAARARLNLRQNRLTDLEILFTALPKINSGHHFGSRLVLDGDYLYISLGDRGDKDQAQNTKNHLGSIIRIHTDGRIPEDNPFVDNPDIPYEIYAYGIRNAQGMTQNPETGAIWEHEHGPQGGDELNIIRASTNYGWPAATLGVNYVIGTKISPHTSLAGMADPIHHWTPSIAPSGMSFYHGDKFPMWKGNLFVGALAHRKLMRLELDGEKVTHEEILMESYGKRIRDVRTGKDGYLYLVTDETNGALVRLMPDGKD